MIGILIASHGSLAPGMRDSLTMFFGQDLPQIDTISLKLDSSVEKFGQEMDQKIAALDTGDGVVIFTDMFGGTPCNQALLRASDRVHVICGVNLPMLMEFIPQRAGCIHFGKIIAAGKDSIFDAKEMLEQHDHEHEHEHEHDHDHDHKHNRFD